MDDLEVGMNWCCENCGWSEIVGTPIMCNYKEHRAWRDECCEAWKPKNAPAVPLDKLCEWLANSFSDPPCCVLENVRCKMECRGFTQMDYSECWRYVLTKWMEGLDGTD